MTNNTLTVSVPPEYAGKTLMEALGKEGFFVDADCGGSGRCGKCSVEVLADDGWKSVRSCRFVVRKSGETVKLSSRVTRNTANEKTCSTEDKDGLSAAFDVGTTTLEAVLVLNGRILRTASALNPQRIHGADVLSRISFASESSENVRLLQKEVTEGLLKLKETLGAPYTERAAVCGNPAMIHLFLGENPEKMGSFPYKPEFSDARDVIGGPLANVTAVLPGSDKKFVGSAFIGSDTTAAAAYAGLNENNLLMDLGTNGEIVFKRNGKLFAGSTAAGPCFEGGNITCGTGGVPGAISHAALINSVLVYETVGDKPPVGICGAGLIDLIAILLRLGKISPDGFMAENFEISGLRGQRREDSGLYITPGDVRAFQLAKAAVSAAIDVILEAAGAAVEDINKVFIAGNLGRYINEENAIATGIIPPEFRGKIKAIGNAALLGTAECLVDDDFCNKIGEIAENITVVDVGSAQTFNEKFIEKINFTEEKNGTGV